MSAKKPSPAEESPFPTFGIVLSVSAAALTTALFYLGDGRADWCLCGLFCAWTNRWAGITFDDYRAYRAARKS